MCPFLLGWFGLSGIEVDVRIKPERFIVKSLDSLVAKA
jgi:hypothetical protein